MRLWLGVVVLLSMSCDKIIRLSENIDAPPEKDADLRPDAVDCVLYPGGQPDEDADGRNDFCDNCPTVSNVTQIDGDGDEVGYDCDPAPLNAGDHIAAFFSMLSAEGLELESSTLSNGAATIKTGKVKVTTPVKPTFVVAEVSMRSFNTGDKLTVEVANTGQEWSCNLGFGLAECAGNNCQYTKAPSPQAIQPINFDEVAMTTRVVMETRGNGFTQCITTTAPGMPETRSFATSSPVVEAQGSVAVKMQGDLELRNVIVYDRP